MDGVGRRSCWVSSSSIRGTHTFTHTDTKKHTHTFLLGKDSVSCPHWRMKKHSARVAPLSSYSTQVLTCPISEGKLSKSGSSRHFSSKLCEFFFSCMCVYDRTKWVIFKGLTVKNSIMQVFFYRCDLRTRLHCWIIGYSLNCFRQDSLTVVFCCWCSSLLVVCLHHPFIHFSPDSSSKQAASSQPCCTSSDLFQKTIQKTPLETMLAIGDCRHEQPACYILDWAAPHPSTPSVCAVSSAYKTLNGLRC